MTDNQALALALERRRSQFLSQCGCGDVRCDAAVLAAEVDRLERELATATMMRDAWMGECQRVQAATMIRVTSSSSTNLPLRDDTPPDDAGWGTS